MRFKDIESRYRHAYRLEIAALENFAKEEKFNSDNIIYLYKQRKEDMPDDIYRACAFFINSEYVNKSGSLWLLYSAFEKLQKEMPDTTMENGIDKLLYTYQMYAKVLAQGGF